MDVGGFDVGGFPGPDLVNDVPHKKKKKKSKKATDAFGFGEGGESAPEDVQRTNSGRRVSFSDEAMGRPIEEFAGGFGQDPSSPAGRFPGGTSGPCPGYSSPTSVDPYPVGSPTDRPIDRFEDSVFSSGGHGQTDLPSLGPPPSAIDQALGRAAESHNRSQHPGHSTLDNAPSAIGFQDEYGRGGLQRFSEDFGGSLPVQRGFSFSLNDMPDGNIGAGESPYYVGAHPPTRDHLSQPQKWNPLDGISRHWAETEREAIEMPSIGTTAKSVGASGAFPGSTAKPGSLEEELQMAEQRVKALHNRLFELESGGAAATPAAQGHLKITVPFPLDGSKLGVAIKDLAVANIVDSRAIQHGWCVGDRILQVNGFPVCYMQEFAVELNKALAANRSSSRPLVFDIWRQAGPAGVQPAATVTQSHAVPVQPPVSAVLAAPVVPATLPPSTGAGQFAKPVQAKVVPRRRTVCGERADSDSEANTQVSAVHAAAAPAAAGGAEPPRVWQTMPPTTQGSAGVQPLDPSRVITSPAIVAPMPAGSGPVWVPPNLGPPASAPVQGTVYPMGFAQDSSLPATVTTVPTVPGPAVMNGHSSHGHASHGHGSHDSHGAHGGHSESSHAAMSRRRRMVC